MSRCSHLIRTTSSLLNRGCHRYLFHQQNTTSSAIAVSSFSRLSSSSSSSTAASDETLSSILRRVENGTLTASDATKLLRSQSSSILKNSEVTTHLLSSSSSSYHRSNKKDVVDDDTLSLLESFANLDHNRAKRTGFPEAVFASGKTPEQIVAILDDMAGHVNASILEEKEKKEGKGRMMVNDMRAYHAILATRVDKTLYEQVSAMSLRNGTITYHETARIISMQASALDDSMPNETLSTDDDSNKGDCKRVNGEEKKRKRVIVACAGTTDLPVSEEAAVTLEAAGCEVDRVYDVGVAGLHRIVGALPRLRHPDVRCVIVCAGMDGALPSVVGGLVSVPVIAVPTSVGYGASFGGLSAMLTMLNSCSPGVGVVNVDNGFGAAALAFKCLNN